jgi:hypothetical protein
LRWPSGSKEGEFAELFDLRLHRGRRVAALRAGGAPLKDGFDASWHVRSDSARLGRLLDGLVEPADRPQDACGEVEDLRAYGHGLVRHDAVAQLQDQLDRVGEVALLDEDPAPEVLRFPRPVEPVLARAISSARRVASSAVTHSRVWSARSASTR